MIFKRPQYHLYSQVSDLEVYENCGHSHDIQKTPVDLLASKTVNLQGTEYLRSLTLLWMITSDSKYVL